MNIKHTFGSLIILLFSIPAMAQWNTSTSGVYYNGTAEARDFKGDYAQYGSNAYVSGHTSVFAHLGTNAWYTGGQWNFNGPGALFQLDNTGGFRFYKHDGNSIGISDQQMILNSNGNLGIGVASPTKKLEVAGDVKATAFQGNGTLLTNLSASNISSGVLSSSRIPELNASKITSGTFNTSLIPDLNASKITGVLDVLQVPNSAYMITSEGTNGQIWTSDGNGKGYWATSSAGGNANSDYTQYGTAAYISGHSQDDFAHLGTNAWHAGGQWNFNGQPGVLFQLDNTGGFRFYKHDGNSIDISNQQMILSSSGNLGIGITAPTEKLEIAGALRIGFNSGSTAGTIRWTGTDFEGYDGSQWQSFTSGTSGSTSGYWANAGNAINYNGNVGVGTSNVDGQFHIEGDAGNQLILESTTTNPDLVFKVAGVKKSQIRFSASLDGLEFFDNDITQPFMFSKNRRVGIGTTNPQYELDVAGTIRACQIEVNELGGWCDYVFEDDYELPALNEVEAYIKANKHLQDIPSEAEVMEHGVSLNDMTTGLLKKVEELTLYMIEKEKQVQMLLNRIEELEKQ